MTLLTERNTERKDTTTRFWFWYDKNSWISWGYGKGWNDLVYNLLEDIEEILDYYDQSTEQFSVAQIKEKFGMLTFYWTADDLPPEAFLDIQDTVAIYQHLSLTICEGCGKRGNKGGSQFWIKTLCPKCQKTYDKHHGKSLYEEFKP